MREFSSRDWLSEGKNQRHRGGFINHLPRGCCRASEVEIENTFLIVVRHTEISDLDGLPHNGQDISWWHDSPLFMHSIAAW